MYKFVLVREGHPKSFPSNLTRTHEYDGNLSFK